MGILIPKLTLTASPCKLDVRLHLIHLSGAKRAPPVFCIWVAFTKTRFGGPYWKSLLSRWSSIQNAPNSSFWVGLVWFCSSCQLPKQHLHVNCNSTQGHTASLVTKVKLLNHNRPELQEDNQLRCCDNCLHNPRTMCWRDPSDTNLPVGRSVWTTCGHVVWNELALAVRFE